MRLEKKVAIVTGAGGGLGRAIAMTLSTEGATLVLNDIATGPLTEVADKIASIGRSALVSEANVTKAEEVKQMVKAALDRFGAIDILVNVAGGSARLRKPGPFHDLPDAYWNAVIDLNLKGTLICCHEVIRPMIEGGGGRIINIGSVAGMIGSSVGMADYSAAKAGVIGFTKALAKELASSGINVNCVSPGTIETPLYATLGPEAQEKLKTGIYLKRLGKPEEVANLVVFLASDAASYITGQNYAVCGGRSLGW
jgi:NAD(P)-dependent dehydrogenase (short-subunit alcohol dehydrogenase family)